MTWLCVCVCAVGCRLVQSECTSVCGWVLVCLVCMPYSIMRLVSMSQGEEANNNRIIMKGRRRYIILPPRSAIPDHLPPSTARSLIPLSAFSVCDCCNPFTSILTFFGWFVVCLTLLFPHSTCVCVYAVYYSLGLCTVWICWCDPPWDCMVIIQYPGRCCTTFILILEIIRL